VTAKPDVILTVLWLAPASGYELEDSEALRELAVRSREAGFQVDPVAEINSVDEFHTVWDRLCVRSKDQVQFLLISAHGDRAEGLGLTNGQVDLDRAMASLRAAAKCDTYVFVDACEVDVSQVRFVQASPVFVMLANPSGEALGNMKGGLLTQALTQIVGRTACPATLLTRTVDFVRRRSPQVPVIRTFGADLSGVRAILPVRDGAEAVSFVNTLLRESLRQAIAPEFLPSFEEVSAKLPNTYANAARLVLMAHSVLTDHDNARWIVEILDDEQRRAKRPEQRVARARALHAIGWYLRGTQAQRAASVLEDAVDTVGDAHAGLLSHILDTQGLVLRTLRDWSHAIVALDRSQDIKKASGDIHSEFLTIHNKGWTVAGMGDFARSETVFEEAVTRADQFLSSPLSNADGRQLVSVLDTKAFCTVGLATMRLIRGASQREFSTVSLRGPGGFMLKPGEWGAKGPHTLAEILCRVGSGGVRAFSEVITNNPREFVWHACGRVEQEGASEWESFRTVLLQEAEEREPQRYLNALAAASHLYFRQPSDANRRDLLNGVLEKIRKLDRSIDPIEAWPWRMGAASRPIDVTRWYRMGDFSRLADSIGSNDTVPYPTVTEHFLQVLTWYSMVLLAFEGAVEYDHVVSIAASVTSCRFMLGLRSAFDIARKVAGVAKPKSEWGHLLKAFWNSEPWARGGYTSCDQCVMERTEVAHAGGLRHAEAARIIDRQARIIDALSDVLRQADTISLRGDLSLGDEDTRLTTGLMKNSRGGTYTCGVLLAVNERNEMHVPHEINFVVGDSGQHMPCTVTYRGIADCQRGAIKVRMKQ